MPGRHAAWLDGTAAATGCRAVPPQPSGSASGDSASGGSASGGSASGGSASGQLGLPGSCLREMIRPGPAAGPRKPPVPASVPGGPGQAAAGRY